MRKLKLLLLWDLDHFIFIVIVLLASKSLVTVDIPAGATLRLGTVIKAITVPTCRKPPEHQTSRVLKQNRLSLNNGFCKKYRHMAYGFAVGPAVGPGDESPSRPRGRVVFRFGD